MRSVPAVCGQPTQADRDRDAPTDCRELEDEREAGRLGSPGPCRARHGRGPSAGLRARGVPPVHAAGRSGRRTGWQRRGRGRAGLPSIGQRPAHRRRLGGHAGRRGRALGDPGPFGATDELRGVERPGAREGEGGNRGWADPDRVRGRERAAAPIRGRGDSGGRAGGRQLAAGLRRPGLRRPRLRRCSRVRADLGDRDRPGGLGRGHRGHAPGDPRPTDRHVGSRVGSGACDLRRLGQAGWGGGDPGAAGGGRRAGGRREPGRGRLSGDRPS